MHLYFVFFRLCFFFVFFLFFLFEEARRWGRLKKSLRLTCEILEGQKQPVEVFCKRKSYTSLRSCLNCLVQLYFYIFNVTLNLFLCGISFLITCAMKLELTRNTFWTYSYDNCQLYLVI